MNELDRSILNEILVVLRRIENKLNYQQPVTQPWLPNIPVWPGMSTPVYCGNKS